MHVIVGFRSGGGAHGLGWVLIQWCEGWDWVLVHGLGWVHGTKHRHPTPAHPCTIIYTCSCNCYDAYARCGCLDMLYTQHVDLNVTKHKHPASCTSMFHSDHAAVAAVIHACGRLASSLHVAAWLLPRMGPSVGSTADFREPSSRIL